MNPRNEGLEHLMNVVTGNTGNTEPENRLFYPALDGLRAVAFLLVVGQHYVSLPWGWTGVDIFFVLSGFLITGILFDTRNDKYRVRNFYVRRTLRIFPLYYACLIFLLLSYPIFHWAWNARALAWPLYLGNFLRYLPAPAGSALVNEYVNACIAAGVFHGHHVVLYFGHFWSLCLEEQFYLLWPWFVFSFVRSQKALIYICASSIPLCLFARIAGQIYAPQALLDQNLLYGLLPFRLDALLFGGLLALLLRTSFRNQLLALSRRMAWPIFGALLVWFFSTSACRIFVRPYSYSASRFTIGLTIIDLLSGLLILLAIQTRTMTFRVLNQRFLRWLGRLSYGAYVFHDIPHALYGTLVSRFSVVSYHLGLVTTLVALGGTMGMAALSFRFLESPFLDLKEKLTKRPEAG